MQCITTMYGVQSSEATMLVGEEKGYDDVHQVLLGVHVLFVYGEHCWNLHDLIPMFLVSCNS